MTLSSERWTMFTVGFCLSYGILYALRIPTLVYLPRRGEFVLFETPVAPELLPAMLWYGWVLSGVIGGLLISALIPQRLAARLSPSVWVWPVLLALYTLNHEAHYFK